MENGGGVYLLFRDQRLVYVGRSKNADKRIGTHRKNGRAFDYAVSVPCPHGDVDWIERALISALNPPQNRLGVTVHTAEPELRPIVQIMRPVQAAPAPDLRETMSLTAGNNLAQRYDLHHAFAEAVKDGSLRTAPKNPALCGPGARRLVSRGDLDAWITAKLIARSESGWKDTWSGPKES